MRHGSRVVRPVGEAEQLLAQLTRRLVPARTHIKEPESPQGREELRRLTHLLTQPTRPAIGSFHLRGCVAFDVYQRHTEGDVEQEFLLGARWSDGQGLEQRQPPGEVTNRFHVRRAFDGSLPRLVPITDRLFVETCLSVVM